LADVLAVGAHPDDVELSFGATLARLTAGGARVHVLDLTGGERGTRGDAATRAREAAEAARVLGVSREGAGLPDLGVRADDPRAIRAVAEIVRHKRPALVLAPHPEEGHPDHRQASALVERACFEARLAKADVSGSPHRIDQLLFAWPAAGASQSAGAGGGGAWGEGFVVDVTETWERKRQALACYASQFESERGGSETRLSRPGFLALVEARARIAGAAIEALYGEGYTYRGALRLSPALAGWLGHPAEAR
jgi:bacillithiol biosynthesis deacetylase BshB1